MINKYVFIVIYICLSFTVPITLLLNYPALIKITIFYVNIDSFVEISVRLGRLLAETSIVFYV